MVQRTRSDMPSSETERAGLLYSTVSGPEGEIKFTEIVLPLKNTRKPSPSYPDASFNAGFTLTHNKIDESLKQEGKAGKLRLLYFYRGLPSTPKLTKTVD